MRGKDSKDRKLDALGKVPLLGGLSGPELRTVARAAREETFVTGGEIVREGGQGGRFYLILTGRAKVVVGGRSRRTLYPGDFFGELTVIDSGPRSASVVAETDLGVLSLSPTEFFGLLQDHWSITRKLLVALSGRLRAAEKSTTH